MKTNTSYLPTTIFAKTQLTVVALHSSAIIYPFFQGKAIYTHSIHFSNATGIPSQLRRQIYYNSPISIKTKTQNRQTQSWKQQTHSPQFPSRFMLQSSRSFPTHFYIFSSSTPIPNHRYSLRKHPLLFYTAITCFED